MPTPHASGLSLTLTPNYGTTGTVVYLTGSGFTPMNTTQCLSALQLPGLYVSSAGCSVPISGALDGSFVLASGNNPAVYPVALETAQAFFTVVPATTITVTSTITATTTSTATVPATTISTMTIPATTTSTATVPETTTITNTVYSGITTVSTANAPSITVSPSYALAGSSGTVTITGANFADTDYHVIIDVGSSVLTGAAAGPISSGSFVITLTVNPLASVGSYTLVAHGSSGDSASCPFVILPSTTATSTVYSPTVTSISTSISKTTRSTTVTETSTSYIATTTGGTYTSYLYTWTYPGYTTLTIPTATVTIYGVSVQTIYTGVMTETQQYTVTMSQQNVATVGGGTTTLWSTQTLPTTAMLTVINGTTSVFVTESNYVEPSITVQTVTQTVNPPTTQQSTPEIPLWLIVAIILTAVGGGAVGLFFVLRRGGVLSRLRPKPEHEEEPEPAPVPKLDTDTKPEGDTETVAQPAPAQVSPSGKVMCGGCGAENIDLATTCELCGLPLAPRTTAESEDAMAKVGTGEGGAWHT